MKATDTIKRSTLNALVDYITEDPEPHIEKIMSMLDTVLPTACSRPSARRLKAPSSERTTGTSSSCASWI